MVLNMQIIANMGAKAALKNSTYKYIKLHEKYLEKCV